MAGARNGWMRSDDAVVPALALVVLAGLTVAGSATIYVVVRTADVGGDVPPVLLFSSPGAGCPPVATLTQATENVPFGEVEVRPVGGSGASTLAIDGVAAFGGAWTSDAAGTLGPGTRVVAWAEDERTTFEFVHASSGHVVGGLTPSHEPDDAAPAVTLAVPPSFDGALAEVSGGVTDPGCSGAAEVRVAVEDVAAARWWDGAAWIDATYALPATLEAPGEPSSRWTLDTSDVPWEDGRTYRFTAAAADGAGNGGAAESATSTEGGAGGPNQAPTASFTFACADLACDFDASASSDPDGAVVSYAWDFGDGATGTGVSVAHAYGAGGSYTVTLTVSDDGSATDDDVRAATVRPPGAAPPAYVGDPGWSYEDLACDFEWDAGEDVDVSAEVQAGLFTTPHCLVITPSEPPVTIPGAGGSILYEAEAMYVGTDLSLAGVGGDLTLRTTEDGLRVRAGVSAQASGAGGDVTLDVAGEAVVEGGALLKAAGQAGVVSIAAGLDATVGSGATLHAAGKDGRVLVDAGGVLTADNVLFRASGKDGLVRLVSGGTMWIEGASLDASGLGADAEADASATTNTIHLDGASVADEDGTLRVGPAGVPVAGALAAGAWSH